MNVVDQNQDHRGNRGRYHESNGTRRHQQQTDRERTAVDIEVPQRMHEIFQKERRAGHEHEKRHVRIVETEGAAKQLNEQTERDKPDAAAEREYQPHRHLGKKQRNDGADQCALGKAEMIIDQQMDVGDIGFAGDLVEKNPDQNSDVDGKHQAPGIFPHTQIHSAPEKQ